jgi:hypothetical protein
MPVDRRAPSDQSYPRQSSLVRVDLAIMLAAFVIASALAGALGAVNLGTALAFGQMAFALAAVLVILRRS